MPVFTKPPPPPPKFHAGMKVRPQSNVDAPSWREVLERAGYPTDVVVLDFETFSDSDYSLRDTDSSTVEYVTDRRFEMIGLASCIMTGPEDNYEDATHFVSTEEMVRTQIKCLQKKYGEHLQRCTVVAQNAPFDGLILDVHFGINPPFVIDTLGLARAWNSRTKNGLEHLCKRLGLTEKGDTSQFIGMTFRPRMKRVKGRKKGPKLPVQMPIATPEQVKQLEIYTRNDAMREWEVFAILLPKLSRPEFELRVMQRTLELYWKPTLGVDQAKCAELIAAMEAEIDKVMQSVGATREEISGDKSFSALLDAALLEALDDPSKYYKQGKKAKLLAIAKDDYQREQLEDHEDERVRNLMDARVALDSWPGHIKRIRKISRQAIASKGLLRVPLKYHGAHTGRDSGREKLNLQNLGTRGHPLVNAVREVIIARPGQKLVIVDESQIEARVLAWIAGQDDLCVKFAAGEEIYCGFASKVLGLPIRKPKKNGIPAIEARMKWARNSIGKIGVLGCGFGMGTTRIFEYAAGAIDLATAEKIKVTYRTENQMIVKFWRDIEKAFIYTAKYKQPCEMPRGLRFESRADCEVVIILPSGRELHYHKIKLVNDERFGDKFELWNDIENHWEHAWGGLLTENVVQAIARDTLMEAMERLEELGHHTAHRIHDELVIPVPEADAENVLKIAVAEMSRRPAWGPDLPLGAEGVVRDRYGAH